MKETVNTGGLKKFIYTNKKPERNLEEDRRIEEAYDKARKRKKKEKWIALGFVLLIIISIIIYSILK